MGVSRARRLPRPVWLATPRNKRCPNFVYECLECHGGVGYVEETPMPRLFREAPLNAIWEGSGNVMCLDVLRALSREGEADKTSGRVGSDPSAILKEAKVAAPAAS